MNEQTLAAPPAKPKRPLLTLLKVVLAIAAFCGVGQLITVIVNRDPLEKKGQPVPALSVTPAAPTPTWKAPNMLTDPKPELEIRHDLESWLLGSAGVAAPVTSDCDAGNFTGAQAATFTCTVTYRDLDVRYEVTATPKDQYLFTWDATAEQTVITKAGILAKVGSAGYNGDDGWRDVRCDEFPEVALVKTGEVLPQHCYVRRGEHDKTEWMDITPGKQGVTIERRNQ